MDLTPAQEVDDLRRELNRHNRLYYIDAAPQISDLEYDKLLKRLEQLERDFPELDSPDSPSHKVGGEPIAGFQTMEHRLPMLSIDNSYTEAEVFEFDERVRKLLEIDPERDEVEYTVEYKIDGVAMALIYENGILTQALTRGDGQRGDDITHNSRTVGGVPLKLESDNPPAILEVRGEAYIANSEFAKLRAAQIERKEEPYANPRNTTAGALKLLDPKLCAARKVRFFAHGIGFHDGLDVTTHTDYLVKLREFGIPTTPDVEMRVGIVATMQRTSALMEELHALDFEVDGLVIKVNQFAQRDQLGNTSKSPRWLIAYKWERYEAMTKVENIEIQVGKTGALTPVAYLTPVEIAGTTVSRASLHNRDELDRLGVKIGDTVVVEKAGKIIPHVVRVEEGERDGSETEFPFPEQCPECGAEVAQDEGGVYIRCQNPGCPAQLRESLRYFASRKAMDIEGMGIKVIEQLMDAKLLTSFADVYRLKDQQEALLNLERMGTKSVEKLLSGIEASKEQPLWRLLPALNIRHVGRSSSRLLADTFGTMDKIMEQTAETLAETDEIGPIIAQSIYNYFHSEHGRAIIEDLRACGLNFGSPVPEPIGDQEAEMGDEAEKPLTGKKLVVTGTLSQYTRDEIKELILQNGGKASSSISAKTDYLVAGEKAGSKLEKADKLGVKILTEQEFLDLIGAGGASCC